VLDIKSVNSANKVYLLTYLLTYVLIPRSRVLLEKLTGSQLVKKFPAFYGTRDNWVLVNTAWRVLRLRMEERHPIWRAAENILNKQSRTADKGWSSSLGDGRSANNSLP